MPLTFDPGKPDWTPPGSVFDPVLPHTTPLRGSLPAPVPPPGYQKPGELPAPGPPPPRPIVGRATVFGLNLDGTPDQQDNGKGAGGANTRDPNLVGVSLPLAVLKAKFGNYMDGMGQMVEVTNPKTGKTVRAPIVDVGPAPWTGNVLDLTLGAAQALGSSGQDTMHYRFLDGDTPAFSLDDPNTPEYQQMLRDRQSRAQKGLTESEKVLADLFKPAAAGQPPQDGYHTPPPPTKQALSPPPPDSPMPGAAFYSDIVSHALSGSARHPGIEAAKAAFQFFTPNLSPFSDA